MTAAAGKKPRVVLLCGMLGIARLLWREYFHGVRPVFEQAGFAVLAPQLPFARRIETRAQYLQQFLRNETAPLHLVAHSMGGIDARFFISRLAGSGKVASLTTLASPHRGSAAADAVVQSCCSPFRLLPAVGDLTRPRMMQFNAQTPNAPGVRYFSYSAALDIGDMPLLTRRFGRIIQSEEGDNDSQVSVASAIWGEHIRTLACDHFEMIGLNLRLISRARRRSFDHLTVYREIAERLRDTA